MTERTVAARLKRAVAVQDDEVRTVAWAFIYFFCLMAGYYVLRSLRDAMGVAGGVKQLPWLFMGTLATTTACTPLLSLVVSRYSRSKFIPLVYRFFQVNLAVFFLLFKLYPGGGQVYVARAFFVWVSVFNLFAVSVFWGYMADIFNSEQGKRLFGLIGLGGTLGAASGAFLNTQLAERLGVVNLLIVSGVLLELGVQSVHQLVRIARPRVANFVIPDRPIAAGGIFEALARVFYSPYLLGISVCMLMYTVSTTFLYFEQARIVKAAFGTDEARTAFLAKIDLYINLVTAVMQLLITARLVMFMGVGASMAFVPIVTMAGFVALLKHPTAAVLLWFQVVKNAANYGLGRPAREALYTVVRPEEKYKSKSFIDTFVFRAGDAAGAWAYKFITEPLAALLATPAGVLVGVSVGAMSAVWIVYSAWLGRRQREMAELRASEAATGSPFRGFPADRSNTVSAG